MKKSKILIFILGLLVIGLCCFLIYWNFFNNEKVCVKGNCFIVEIVVSPEQKAKGLMYRNFLDSDRGMLFVYSGEKQLGFWMKNTLIALDIIWINENNQIVYIWENAKPCETLNCKVVKPDISAKYVLEINGGLSGKLGIAIGDLVEFKYFFYS